VTLMFRKLWPAQNRCVVFHDLCGLIRSNKIARVLSVDSPGEFLPPIISIIANLFGLGLAPALGCLPTF